MDKQKILKALENKGITDFEIIDHQYIPKLSIIVKSEIDKNFVENYLHENLEAKYFYKVIIKK
jgi:hypothetical protein